MIPKSGPHFSLNGILDMYSRNISFQCMSKIMLIISDWENSMYSQKIFKLIFRAGIVDFCFDRSFWKGDGRCVVSVNKDEWKYRTHATMCNNTVIDCQLTWNLYSSCPNTTLVTTKCEDNQFFCNRSKTCVSKGIYAYLTNIDKCCTPGLSGF